MAVFVAIYVAVSQSEQSLRDVIETHNRIKPPVLLVQEARISLLLLFIVIIAVPPETRAVPRLNSPPDSGGE